MTLESDKSISFEILDDPEMTDVGHRLIGQGGELLDDTDLSREERSKVEKMLSQCWEILQAVRVRKTNFYRIKEDYRSGKSVSKKEKLGLPEEFGEFVHGSVKTLDYVAKLISLLAQNNVRRLSFSDKKGKRSDSLEDLKNRFSYRSNDLILVIQKAHELWIEGLIDLWMRIQASGVSDQFIIKKGPMLQCGRPELEIVLKNGQTLELFFSETWQHLVDFCEECMVYALQLRFSEFIERLEIIPKEQQDRVYPRRFKTVVKSFVQERKE